MHNCKQMLKQPNTNKDIEPAKNIKLIISQKLAMLISESSSKIHKLKTYKKAVFDFIHGCQ